MIQSKYFILYIKLLLIRETKDLDKEIKNNNKKLQPVAGPMIIKETSSSNNYKFKAVNKREEINEK